MASPSPEFADRSVGARFRTAVSLVWPGALIVALAAPLLSRTAYAHGIAGNRYFPGTLTLDDPAVADEAIVPNFSHLDHPTEAPTSRTIASIGLLHGFSRRPSALSSITAGSRATGASQNARVSTSPALGSNGRFFATIPTRRCFPQASFGASRTPAQRGLMPARPIRSGRGCFLAKVLAICPIAFHG